ncbi:hypothetical protein V3C99_011980 [Haemonchus contortus]
MISRKNRALIIILAHGYTSTLIFYVIGEFYHTRSTRIIYFINRFINSSIIFSIMFAIIFLSNRGIPPSLSFLSEFIIITNSIILNKILFFFVFVYFIISFYYSLFLIVNSLAGKVYINYNNNNFGIMIFLIVIMYNIF